MRKKINFIEGFWLAVVEPYKLFVLNKYGRIEWNYPASVLVADLSIVSSFLILDSYLPKRVPSVVLYYIVGYILLYLVGGIIGYGINVWAVLKEKKPSFSKIINGIGICLCSWILLLPLVLMNVSLNLVSRTGMNILFLFFLLFFLFKIAQMTHILFDWKYRSIIYGGIFVLFLYLVGIPLMVFFMLLITLVVIKVIFI